MAEGFAVSTLQDLTRQIERYGGDRFLQGREPYLHELINAVGRGALIRKTIGHGMVNGVLHLYSHATQTNLVVHYYVNMVGTWGRVEFATYDLPTIKNPGLRALLIVTYDCALKTRPEFTAADKFKIINGSNLIVRRVWPC